jgi:hypothetical protein
MRERFGLSLEAGGHFATGDDEEPTVVDTDHHAFASDDQNFLWQLAPGNQTGRMAWMIADAAVSAHAST